MLKQWVTLGGVRWVGISPGVDKVGWPTVNMLRVGGGTTLMWAIKNPTNFRDTTNT